MILGPSLFWSHKPVLMHLDQTLSFSNSDVSSFHYTPNRKHGDGKPRSLNKQSQRKLRGFYLRVFRFECGAKWKTRSWKTSKFDQSTSEFDQNASEKISEVYIQVFSFGYCAKWKTWSEKTSENILWDFRELRVFDLTLYLLDIKCVTVVYSWCTHSENKMWVYCQSRQCQRKLHQNYEMKSHIFFLLCA